MFDIKYEERLKQSKLFLRFLKEKHYFKNTITAYKIGRKLNINRFEDIINQVFVFSPYMSMFDMTYTALKMKLDSQYFYQANKELTEFMNKERLYNGKLFLRFFKRKSFV